MHCFDPKEISTIEKSCPMCFCMMAKCWSTHQRNRASAKAEEVERTRSMLQHCFELEHRIASAIALVWVEPYIYIFFFWATYIYIYVHQVIFFYRFGTIPQTMFTYVCWHLRALARKKHVGCHANCNYMFENRWWKQRPQDLRLLNEGSVNTKQYRLHDCVVRAQCVCENFPAPYK